jgi:MFS family permease
MTGNPQGEPEDEAGTETGRAWYLRLTTSLYITTFTVRSAFAMIFIVFPVYIGGIEGYLPYALVLSTWPALELATVLGFGAAIDRKGRKNMLVMGAAVSAIALFFFSASAEPLPVALVNGLMGVAAAALLVSSLTLMADYAPKDKRGRELGVFQFVQIFGWLFGFALGGVLLEVLADGLEWVFVISGGMCAFGAVYAYLNVAEPRRERYLADELNWSHLVSVLRQRAVVLLVAPWFVIYLLISTVFTFSFKASYEVLNLSGFQLAGLLLGGGTVLLVTFVLFGRLSDRLGRMPIMIVGTVGMVGLMMMVGIMFMTWPGGDISTPAADHVNRFLIPIGVFAFAAGAFAPSALASLVDVSATRKRGMTMGLYSFVISLAMAVGPIMSGAIIDRWGGEGTLVFLFTCGGLMLLVVTLRWRDERREGGRAAQ